MIEKPSTITDIKNLPEVITLTRDFFPFVAGTKIYKQIIILDKSLINSDTLLKYSFTKVKYNEDLVLFGGIKPNPVKMSSNEFTKMIEDKIHGRYFSHFHSTDTVKAVYSPEGSDFQFSLEQVSNENWFSPLND